MLEPKNNKNQAKNKPTIIDELYYEYNSIIEALDKNKDMSLRSYTNGHFTKALTLSAASFFEHEITNLMLSFVKANSNDNEMILSLVKQKAIKRQYHTYFNWESGNNVNTFLSLFGDNFKKTISKEIKDSEELSKAAKSFLEIGQKRNILVHQNYADYNLESHTMENIYELYQKAYKFIEFIKEKLV